MMDCSITSWAFCTWYKSKPIPLRWWTSTVGKTQDITGYRLQGSTALSLTMGATSLEFTVGAKPGDSMALCPVTATSSQLTIPTSGTFSFWCSSNGTIVLWEDWWQRYGQHSCMGFRDTCMYRCTQLVCTRCPHCRVVSSCSTSDIW